MRKLVLLAIIMLVVPFCAQGAGESAVFGNLEVAS
jgi:hypothetical protein